jgi:hypothetical protein
MVGTELEKHRIPFKAAGEKTRLKLSMVQGCGMERFSRRKRRFKERRKPRRDKKDPFDKEDRPPIHIQQARKMVYIQ